MAAAPVRINHDGFSVLEPYYAPSGHDPYQLDSYMCSTQDAILRHHNPTTHYNL